MPAVPPDTRSDGPVLVLDGDQPSALAIVRALGRRGIAVVVGSADEAPLAGYSRHARSTLRYPDPLREGDRFIAWLAAQMATLQPALVIPVTERTVVPIVRQRSALQGSPVAVAPADALDQVLDKDRTLQLAERLGIPVPVSERVTGMDGLCAAAARLGYPVVVKPSRSVGQEAGQRVQLSVGYAFNDTELLAHGRHMLRYGEVILQEYFRGDGVGIELIADHGAVRFAFQHRRLHEVPLTGGGSSLRSSEAIVPALRAASEQLMQALGWHGVAMVEFKYAPDTGAFRLMEINGRFWGSLPLAVAAGADFPVMLHELMTTGAVADRPPARTGVVCRQLARDIDWLEHVLRRAGPPQLVRFPSRGQVLRDCLLVFSPRHHFDVQSFTDPRPGLVDLARIARKQWRRVADKLAERRRLAAELQAGVPGAAAGRQMTTARNVLFLCYGNINRSALAHARAQALLGGRLGVQSAGFHSPEGRPADPVMVEVAAEAGVDLAGWRSHTLSAEMVARADVIFAMEAAHLDRLLGGHPAARGKAFLLGAATARGPHEVEVADPYGQPRAEYERVCRQVIRSVDAWLATPVQH